MVEKILIANRGEVACRIIKTAKKMGLKTVAVYSEADINSLHVQMADEAVLLGGSLASESYLDIKKIINACKKTGAKYVHPGWGFLSENAKFAQALEKEDIIFVGPPVEGLKSLGDKIRSKKLAKSAGVSVVPSDNSVLVDVKDALDSAKKIGYPVILKASAGGGGKGIRVVYKKEEMALAFQSVKSEAKNSFGDDRIFVEKYIENPRHIEIQVIGDKFGNVVCLGERECSIQRNHQKVIEEAPSPFVDERTRKKMYAQSVALCKKVGYYSAGTLEFLMDKNKDFYFNEMNTRLQVEHGVTELITGFDLVELMIKVAMGEKLPFKQVDVKLKGWAIESRINAEDPTRGFLPSSGRISKYIEPERNENIRIDTSVYEGYTISMFYDSMIAKLLTYGKDRNEAIQRMKDALGSFYIDGITHNMSFLEAIMYNEKFQKGDISTSFIKQEFSKGFSCLEIDNKDEGILIGTAVYMFIQNATRISNISGQVLNSKCEIADKWVVNVNSNKYLCNIAKTSKGLSVEYGNGFSLVESSWQFGDNVFRGEINGRPVNVKIIKNNKTGSFVLQFMGSNVSISVRSTRVAELEKYMPKLEEQKKPTKLKAPITGKITKFLVKEGDEVKSGSDLVIIEAMKMENLIKTEHDVKIKKINFKDGDLIGVGEILIEFE